MSPTIVIMCFLSKEGSSVLFVEPETSVTPDETSPMDYPTDHPYEAQPRRHKEYEDPHYHDADEVDGGDEPAPQKKAAPGRATPLPRARRRYEE